jgi:acyl-CoA thioester hydrolase
MSEAEKPSKAAKPIKSDNSAASADALAGRMDGPVHVLLVRVYYEDTDALGLVYYANYLKFLERGRTDMLRLTGIGRHDPAPGDAEGLFVVRRCEIDFLVPARLDDVVEIRTSVAGIGGATLDLDQSIRRDGKVLVSAQIRAACVDSTGRPKRLSPKIRQKLQHL